VESRRRHRVERGEEREVDSSRDKPLGEQAGDRLPRPIVLGRRAPGDRREHGELHRSARPACGDLITWITLPVARLRPRPFGISGREVAHDARPERAPPASWPAARAATAMMVSAGLAAPWVGSTLPSVMYRFGTAKLRQNWSTTPLYWSRAIRAPPTRWAYRWMVMTSSAPAACRMSSMTDCAALAWARSLSHWE